MLLQGLLCIIIKTIKILKTNYNNNIKVLLNKKKNTIFILTITKLSITINCSLLFFNFFEITKLPTLQKKQNHRIYTSVIY